MFFYWFEFEINMLETEINENTAKELQFILKWLLNQDKCSNAMQWALLYFEIYLRFEHNIFLESLFPWTNGAFLLPELLYSSIHLLHGPCLPYIQIGYGPYLILSDMHTNAHLTLILNKVHVFYRAIFIPFSW